MEEEQGWFGRGGGEEGVDDYVGRGGGGDQLDGKIRINRAINGHFWSSVGAKVMVVW